MVIVRVSFVIVSSILIFSCSQESILFQPEKLSASFEYHFNNKFKEMNFQVDKKTTLNGLLFKSDSSKGLVFYLHGNAGSLRNWGEIAGVYTQFNYDFFIVDYRGYGKSDGEIENEKQLLSDMGIVYDSLKQMYVENKIIIIGYSIGTGLASYLSSVKNPQQLILKAPYYNIPDLAKYYSSSIPGSIIEYKLASNEYLQKTACPITIFHGDIDEIIPIESSYQLQKHFKNEDTLIVLKNQPHNGINHNPEFITLLSGLLK